MFFSGVPQNASISRVSGPIKMLTGTEEELAFYIIRWRGYIKSVKVIDKQNKKGMKI